MKIDVKSYGLFALVALGLHPDLNGSGVTLEGPWFEASINNVEIIPSPDSVDSTIFNRNGMRKWDESSWYGWFYVQADSWIYHLYHGWQYANSKSEDSIWMYDQELGWFWTNSEIYPWGFMQRMKDWIMYDEGSDSPRWFYNESRSWIASWSTSDPESFEVPQSVTGSFINIRDGVEMTESYSDNGTYERTFTTNGISYNITGEYSYFPYQGLQIADVEIVYTNYAINGPNVSFSGSADELAVAIGSPVAERFQLLYRFADSRTIEISGVLFNSDGSSSFMQGGTFILPD